MNFFYPYLEQKYGLEKLQALWRIFSENPNIAFSEAILLVYKKPLLEIQEEFKTAILDSNYNF